MPSQKTLLVLIFILVLVVIIGAIGVWFGLRPQPDQIKLVDEQVLEEDVFINPEPKTVSEIDSQFLDLNSEESEEIEMVVLSDQVFGSNVTRLDHLSSFSPTTPTIYVTVKLGDQSLADRAGLEISYDKDSKLGPVSVPVLTENATRYSVFKMQRPRSGWPTGIYSAKIYTSSRQIVKIPFVVE